MSRTRLAEILFSFNEVIWILYCRFTDCSVMASRQYRPILRGSTSSPYHPSRCDPPDDIQQLLNTGKRTGCVLELRRMSYVPREKLHYVAVHGCMFLSLCESLLRRHMPPVRGHMPVLPLFCLWYHVAAV